MRKLVGLILITGALVVGLRAVKSKLLLPKAEATNMPRQVLALETGTLEPEQTYSCPNGPGKIVYKLANDKLMYKVYLADKTGKEVQLNEQAWAANVLTVLWNADCSRVGYSTGTASLGFWVTLVEVKTRKEITSLDLHQEFLGAIGGTAQTYSHIYTGVSEWKSKDEVVLKVWGRPDETTQNAQEAFFLVNAVSGKVVRRVI